MFRKLFCTYLLIVCASLHTVQTQGQTANAGKINGRVTDQKSGETVIGATVRVTNASAAAATDVEGRYTLSNLAPGTYSIQVSYVGYQPKAVTDIIVAAGKTTVLDVVLDAAASQQLQEVVITTSFRKETINALYAQQKTSVRVTDGISAESIRRSPDKNTGEVLKRVSGTSIQDNKFVVVRGLSDRYNTSLLNNSVLPSSEPDKKAFSFDVVPSALIDNIVISKTASPDLPGDFTGGAVQITTKDFPDQKFFSVSVGGSVNTQGTFREFLNSHKGKYDFLGYDDGGRAIPSSYKPYNPVTYTNLPIGQQQQISQDFPNFYGVRSTNRSYPTPNLQFSYGNTNAFKSGAKLGYIASLNYRSNFEVNNRERNDFKVDKFPLYQFNDQLYNQGNTLGGLFNLAYSFGTNKIALKNLYSNSFSNNYTTRTGVFNDNNVTNIISSSNDVVRNSLFNSTLEGEHYLEKSRLTINWNLSYGNSFRDTPDQKILELQNRDLADPYFIFLSNYNSPSIQNAGRVYSRLDEDIYGGNFSLSYAYKLFDQNQKIKAGYSSTYRKRDFEVDAFGYASSTFGPVVINMTDGITQENVFDPSRLANAYSSPVILAVIPNNSYYYQGTGYLNAGYIMSDNKFGEKWRVVFGARIENYDQKLTPTFNPTAVQKYLNTDVLPSVNLTYALTGKSNIRVSTSQSVSRPEFRELAAYSYYDFVSDYNVRGNPGLVRALNSNADLRYEYFAGNGQIISGSVFYKHFKNPIEQTNDGNKTFSYTNASEAEDIGLEAEIRQRLSADESNVFNHFTAYANGSYIYSNVKFAAGSTNKDRPLQGQSPYLINAGLLYNTRNNDFAVNLLYNRIGQRLTFVGQNGNLDTYEKPRDVIDLQVSKKLIGDRAELRLNVADLLANKMILYYNYDSRRAYTAGDQIISSVQPGRTISLSFLYNIGFTKN